MLEKCHLRQSPFAHVTIIVLVALASAGCGNNSGPSAKEQLERAGWTVSDGQTTVLKKKNATDEDLKLVAKLAGDFKKLDINIAASKIGDDGLKSVKDSQQIVGLDISKTGVSNAGLAHLAGLKKLTNVICDVVVL